MSDSEFITILMRILSAAQDRQGNASGARREVGATVLGPSDSPDGEVEGAPRHGDPDNERGSSSVKRFIQRTRPSPRRAGRSRGR